MTDARRWLKTACVLPFVWGAGAGVGLAADSSGDDSSTPRFQLLTTFDFHVSLEHLGGDVEQFVWTADYGGDVDLLDYGAGRVNFLANYEAIVGEEFRRFDPNQGNYILDVSSSVRRGALELAVVFHHVSCHLSDRPKTFHIDWNMVGLQAVRPVMVGSSRLHLHGRALWTARRSSVDYRAEYGAGISVWHPIHPRMALVGAGDVTIVPVEADLLGRGTQVGSRLEGGVRIEGTGAAIEFFVAFERRIDADPIEARTRNLGLVGVRLLGL